MRRVAGFHLSARPRWPFSSGLRQGGGPIRSHDPNPSKVPLTARTCSTKAVSHPNPHPHPNDPSLIQLRPALEAVDDDLFAFQVLGVRRLRVGVGRGAQDVVQEVARHLRVLEQHVWVVDRHRGRSDTRRETRLARLTILVE